MAIILKNATYIDPETLVFTRCTIKTHPGNTGETEFFKFPRQPEIRPDDQIIDCTDKLVTKSFVVGHHHIYSALARGMPAPTVAPVNFVEVLKYIWWKLDQALDREMIEASALATAVACAKSGVTFVIDHHASPNFVEGSLEIIARAFDRIGISHLLCYEITDRYGPENAEAGLRETENYLRDHQGLIGLHASFTVGNDTLRKAVELMQQTGSGIHIHVAEDKADQIQCIENHGKRVVHRLAEAGALASAKTVLVHCLHLDSEERKIIENSPAWVVQNMDSNLNNKVGYFSSHGLGDRIMLGTDGMHSDMLRSAKSVFFAGQTHDQMDYRAAYIRFRNAHQYLYNNDFVGDGNNNLVVLDYDSPTEINQENFLGHFIFGLDARHVLHLISNGELVLKDRQIVKANEQEILDFTREQANRLWDRLKK